MRNVAWKKFQKNIINVVMFSPCKTHEAKTTATLMLLF